MPMPPNVRQMNPGMPQQPQQSPQGMNPQQQNPDLLKAKELLLKSELLKLQAQQLIQKTQGGGQPQQRPQQGQPPRR